MGFLFKENIMLEKLFALAIDASDSSSQEGCDSSLIVVGSKEFFALLDEIKRIKAMSVDHDVKPLREFVASVANLKIWGWDRDDGSRHVECDEPDDGAEDSHEALMGLIEAARRIVALPVDTATNE
jgi:hypothetical protein